MRRRVCHHASVPRIHRQWFLFGGASLALLIGGSAWGVSATENASRGPAFHLSATCLRVNKTAKKQLGVITGYGRAVTGPVVDNRDGTGSARLQFDVIGSWLTGRAHVQAIEQDGRWHWAGGRGSTLDVGGKSYPIKLDQVSAVDPAPYSDVCAPPTSIIRFPPS
jgi:hypothetical protein